MVSFSLKCSKHNESTAFKRLILTDWPSVEPDGVANCKIWNRLSRLWIGILRSPCKTRPRNSSWKTDNSQILTSTFERCCTSHYRWKHFKMMTESLKAWHDVCTVGHRRRNIWDSRLMSPWDVGVDQGVPWVLQECSKCQWRLLTFVVMRSRVTIPKRFSWSGDRLEPVKLAVRSRSGKLCFSIVAGQRQVSS